MRLSGRWFCIPSSYRWEHRTPPEFGSTEVRYLAQSRSEFAVDRTVGAWSGEQGLAGLHGGFLQSKTRKAGGIVRHRSNRLRPSSRPIRLQFWLPSSWARSNRTLLAPLLYPRCLINMVMLFNGCRVLLITIECCGPPTSCQINNIRTKWTWQMAEQCLIRDVLTICNKKD